MQLQDFKVINRLGGSATSQVFLACPKKHGKALAKEHLFVVKVIDKSRASNHARYDVDTKKTVQAIMHHPFVESLEYVYMNEQRFFVCTEYCLNGDLGSVIRQKNLKE